jgi:site-specific DNA-cytosine methylase
MTTPRCSVKNIPARWLSLLAAAMGFPADYVFCGSRENRVKQIGNAWPNGLAEALCGELIGSIAA